MDTWKILLIVVLVIVAAWTLYPPDKTLKSGIDLAGGTSLVYEIDTHGYEAGEIKGLSQKMITVLRRRIDPANIQNLIWRPQGNTRFEIQMPLANAETRQKRDYYKNALKELLSKNTPPAQIMRSLQKPAEERQKNFEELAGDSAQKLEILTNLAEVYDQRNDLRGQSEELLSQLKPIEELITAAGLDLDQVKISVGQWLNLDEQKLNEALSDFLGTNENLDLLKSYVVKYTQWADVVDELTEPENGKNIQYKNAKREIDKLNLTEDQIDFVLTMPAKSSKRAEAIESLKAEFADRVVLIDQIVVAFDEYRPFQGRLDDPKDIQRMLKGAGILEFRILPTRDNPDVDADEMNRYIETLKSKGPKYASDKDYIWCEAEKADQFGPVDDNRNPFILASFGDKTYILASNKPDQVMLHRTDEQAWKLNNASSGRDQTGRRAIDLVFDSRAGSILWKVTGPNIERPLCILLDDLAISAPTIQDQLSTQGQITGSFTEEEVRDMVSKLNAGSLPARLNEQPISVKTIGPSIGADNRDRGVKAGIIGLIVVIICMAVYYRVAGLIADVALLMNLLFVLATMALIRATFTLPGIAGIILTIGMSVDANVLIFERIREEQQRGASLIIAIKNGYQRALRTILDANITTFITAAILYWVASEEIKGFAIVLMLGIASSMFTALFVTRVMFNFIFFFRLKWRTMWLTFIITWPSWALLNFLAKEAIMFPPFGFWTNLFLTSIGVGFVVAVVVAGALVPILGFLAWLIRGIIKSTSGSDRLVMMQLIRRPNVNWMKLRPVFFCLSTLLIVAGLAIFVTRDDANNNKYDIEFTGGTSVQINLINQLSRQDVEDRIRKVGSDMGNPALVAANIYSVGQSGKQYEINTTETNKTTIDITFSDPAAHTVETISAALAGELGELSVTTSGSGFVITTNQTSKSLIKDVLTSAFADAQISEPQVDEVVNNAILKAFGDELQIQQNLGPQLSHERISEELIESYPELTDFLGGIKIACEIERPATIEEINNRLADLLFKPDMRDLTMYSYQILAADMSSMEPNKPAESFVYISVDPQAGFREFDEDEWAIFAENETTKVTVAAELAASLPRVTQISPFVGEEAKQQAAAAIVYSLLAIITYIWVRFGNVRYGLAAILALVHDVAITLGAVTVCTYIASTPLGQMLFIGDFKINLAIIAAFLTLIGYSLNDTIVVFDRIRENRHKAQLTAQTITNSINQTISRTLMTSLTTFIVVLIMYIFGGPALRGFTFAIGFGIIIGTYSSIAIAAPILLIGTKAKDEKSKR